MADGMERRGAAGGEDPDGGADGAERAFEALRAEVAELRGAVLGFLLWWPLALGLPWGLGGRLASTLVPGAGRWGAGQTLMHEADPDTWERMARLHNACPKQASTELCEAAMAVRTIPPAAPTQSAPEEAKPAPAAAAPMPQNRGKAGR